MSSIRVIGRQLFTLPAILPNRSWVSGGLHDHGFSMQHLALKKLIGVDVKVKVWKVASNFFCAAIIVGRISTSRSWKTNQIEIPWYWIKQLLQLRSQVQMFMVIPSRVEICDSICNGSIVFQKSSPDVPHHIRLANRKIQ